MPNVIEKTSDFVVHSENKCNSALEMVEAPIPKGVAEVKLRAEFYELSM